MSMVEIFVFVLGISLRVFCLLRVVDFYDTDDGILIN